MEKREERREENDRRNKYREYKDSECVLYSGWSDSNNRAVDNIVESVEKVEHANRRKGRGGHIEKNGYKIYK